MTDANAFVARDRRSIRLSGYDYGQAGAYFVTICTQDRAERFGTIAGSEMRLNDAGRMVRDVWDGIPSHYPGVGIDAFVVMPDHVHGIIVLTDDVSVPVGQAPAPALRWIVGTPAFNVSGYHRGLPLPNPRAPPGPNGCHCPTSSNGSNH